jgi:hypothetical protein
LLTGRGRQGPSQWIICCLPLDSLISKNILSTPLGNIYRRWETKEPKIRYHFVYSNLKIIPCLFLGVASTVISFLLIYMFL